MGLHIFWFCYMREEKDFLVMHVVSTIVTFFVLLSFTSCFPFLCSFTFNSLFKFPRLLCCSLWVLFLFISQLKSICFPLFIFVLHQLPLFAIDTYHTRRVPTTFWLYVNKFNPTIFLTADKGFLSPRLLTLQQAPSYFRQNLICCEYLSPSFFPNGKTP